MLAKLELVSSLHLRKFVTFFLCNCTKTCFNSIQYLRDIKSFFGVSFKIQPDESNDTILMTCMGIGYINQNKKTT